MDTNLKLNELLEKAKTDKRILKYLKEATVRAQSYEFASYLRDIELQNFPETPEEKEAKEISRAADLLLRMVEIGTTPSLAYRISQAFKIFGKKKGKFDIKDASKIICDSERIFTDK
jgi:hypothetical protein